MDNLFSVFVQECLSAEITQIRKRNFYKRKKAEVFELSIPAEEFWRIMDMKQISKIEEPTESKASQEKRKKEILKNPEDDYLKKGERLFLMAEKNAQTIRQAIGHEKMRLLEQLYNSKRLKPFIYNCIEIGFLKEVAKTLFRKPLHDMASMPQCDMEAYLSKLATLYFPDFKDHLSFHVVDDPEHLGLESEVEINAYMHTKTILENKRLFLGKDRHGILIRVDYAGHSAFGFNVPSKKHGRFCWKVNGRKNWFFVMDIELIFSAVTMLQEYHTYLVKRRSDFKQIPLLPFAQDMILTLPEIYLRNFFVQHTSVLRAMGLCDEKSTRMPDWNEIVEMSNFKELLEEASKKTYDKINPFRYYRDLCYGVTLDDLIECNNEYHYFSLYSCRAHDTLITKTEISRMVCCIWHADNPVVEQSKRAQHECTEYAKSYMTKRNISQKTLEYMRSSGFNSYFGYIEVDDSCDLEKVSEVYANFVAFYEKALIDFHIQDMDTVSLRFRRLGNHKASGLYYYNLRCLCVSAKEPSAFVHELGHMVDYLKGGLSVQPEFAEIRSIYEKELCNLPKESFSKGKYGLSYFLEPSEIFARSVEIYFSRIRGYSCPILGMCVGNEYPQNKEYEEAVKKYFDALLGKKGVMGDAN